MRSAEGLQSILKDCRGGIDPMIVEKGLLHWLPMWNTIILLSSSVTVHFAHVGLKNDNRKQFKGWLLFTVLLAIVFLFGLFQAFVGWWMVKSGLSENPYVSPYRLTFHLMNALVIFSMLLWIAMDYRHKIKINFLSKPFTADFYICISILLIFITIASGGFMAGTNSGQSFNTFPLMNGKIIPDDYHMEGYGIYNIFANTVAINFNHRWISIFSFFFIIFFCFKFIKFNNKNISSKLVYLIIFFLTLQVLLGVVTLLSNVYLPLASMHQTNSILLLSTLLISYHQYKLRKVNHE